MEEKFEEIINQLLDRGWAEMPDFLDDEFRKALRAEQLALIAEGEFRQAGIGRGTSFQVRPEIRSDQVLWLEPGDLSPLQQQYWQLLDELRLHINRSCYLGLRSFEGHFARYPQGSFYKRHLDQFSQVSYRIVSAITYLNENWQPGDGGELRIYESAADDASYVDIAPTGGKLVCFLSGEIFHEVLPAHKERYSLTGWFRNID
ncbi:2OG-Fe(II) oxygenase [Penaeicola halotolerans]|uniref:2OG-Fe(II) oxygenase n=1 Tax=Penaeicola halotolerans TaxID=2793196 RepID=UPI001CF8BD2D|nr:2OG-Fe(II) oxygenase [Penaeicola halotolerans]